MIVNARPMMNPFSTGSEMNDAKNPKRSSPNRSAATPVQSANAVVSAAKPAASSVTKSATIAADNAAVADIGPVTRCRELPERRVQQQGAGRSVKADHRGHPGDGRVRQRFGDQHRPHRECRDKISAKPPRPITVQGNEERRDLHDRSIKRARRFPCRRARHRSPASTHPSPPCSPGRASRGVHRECAALRLGAHHPVHDHRGQHRADRNHDEHHDHHSCVAAGQLERGDRRHTTSDHQQILRIHRRQQNTQAERLRRGDRLDRLQPSRQLTLPI